VAGRAVPATEKASDHTEKTSATALARAKAWKTGSTPAPVSDATSRTPNGTSGRYANGATRSGLPHTPRSAMST
jgi:hypothetical protein